MLIHGSPACSITPNPTRPADVCPKNISCFWKYVGIITALEIRTSQTLTRYDVTDSNGDWGENMTSYMSIYITLLNISEELLQEEFQDYTLTITAVKKCSV